MKRQKNAQKERLDPKYHQYFYGPYSGMLGQTVIAASYLGERWDRFVAWLEDRNIDPGPCGRWINEKLELLAVMKAVKRTHTGVADFSGYGAEASDIDWSFFNKSKARKELEASHENIVGGEKLSPCKAKCLNAGSVQHSGYGAETSELLAALYLADDQHDFRAWLKDKNITEANACGYLDWIEAQTRLFRLLIGPGTQKTETPELMDV